MPFPTFTKSGVTTVTFDQGRVFPKPEPQESNQIIGMADDSTVVVAELGTELKFISLSFTGLSVSVVSALFTFLNHANVRWSLNTFTWTDEDGATETVRYWSPSRLEPVEDHFQTYSVSMILKVE